MTSWTSFAPTTASPSTSADDTTPFSGSKLSSSRTLFALGDDYGDEAARELAPILQQLTTVGFGKAQAPEYSAFDRILGGLCWLLQRLVKREDAAHGRVQWALLFQSHDKMKPRLGLAQDVVQRIELLPVSCPVPIQPHQLLLHDFGDIGTVNKLVSWLVELHNGDDGEDDADIKGPAHLVKMRMKREYLKMENNPHETPLKREVVFLQNTFQPRRKWQYSVTPAGTSESEDAIIQRCLLEYGERVAVHITELPSSSASAEEKEEEKEKEKEEGGADPHKSLLAQLAVASAASAARRKTGNASDVGHIRAHTPKSSTAKSDKQTRAFDAQYQRIVQQAMAEEALLLEKQRALETELLKHVVSVPEILSNASETSSEEIQKEQTKLHDQQSQLMALEDEKRRLAAQREQLGAQAVAIDIALQDLEAEAQQVEMETSANQTVQPFVATLRSLMSKNDAFKTQKIEFKANCKRKLEALQARVSQLRLQVEQDASNKDEETLRLQEIEQMHAQMAGKHTEMKLALGRETRKLNQIRKQIDDVPTRIELVQYEKRFLELYDEVALTLDETRKYYSVYNTLTTTHEFLEKEIALINSMHDNYDVAMSSKPATQAFFSQLDAILQGVQVSVRKQRTARADFQTRVETLDSKYQVLLEKERLYVNAIREFQKECEKNDKLAARLAQYQQKPQFKPETTATTVEDAMAAVDVLLPVVPSSVPSAMPPPVGVTSDDVVI